ncbi:MAG: hypothetical protein KME60_21515 [Cyanomargarita calcarea GSE-NOS-MK-12-04C]|jgi:hypothetical protein|uniref:Uncharacterized protein n=1 Tax=Cyanomargarita calcarea GSE-NOS-MK-12-04C TaxID=2839659 RepID=A0A951QQR5_9CYAN|nr:hypothetical protein [Cyanomargarita calcarea GSE-NOS-MK-12-04C]
MQLISISQSLLKQAANVRAATRLKTPDAIHAARALSINCNQFIPILYEDAHNQDPPVVPPCQGGTA